MMPAVRRRRARRGLTLMELLVAIAIMLALMVVVVPSVGSLLDLQQRRAATRLVTLYQQLHDEAAINNFTFRIGFDLRNNTYEVETGGSGAIINASPEQREHYEQQHREKVALMDGEELANYRDNQKPFERVKTQYDRKFELPRGVKLYGVYTPQYGKMVTADDLEELHDDDDDEDAKLHVFSYIFSSGFMEHTVIWLVDERNPREGYTIEIEPLSGKVHLHASLVDWEDSHDWVPESGPSLGS